MTIKVNASPLPEQIWVALRQAVPPVVAFAVGRGYLAGDTATMLGAVAAVLGPIVYGQVRTWKRSSDIMVLANAVPDSVATVK
ncbi:hypothetical protein UFOVP5_12 [uncultured Caudovirales phage]|uniref:Holin n=1 Tax=uncultured Caudovirales phage TaxID=2100421 RepID=A0A6J5KGZ1_9CAUD|nr:hypothetical protein UFOVP5_12 [uncultured Caudovirales phage]